MSKNAPLLHKEDGLTKEQDGLAMKQKLIKYGGIGCGGCFLVCFIGAWILQGFMYWYATIGCSARTLNGYSYPGGGVSDHGGPEYNLVPRIALLAERSPSFWGQAFDSIPSNEASAVGDAPSGTWWRTWGPIYNTYTYEDVANSKVTIYMRRNLLRLGMSHRIERCDGQSPHITFTEGSNYFMNRIRSLFGMNQGMTFKIYMDNDLVGLAEETSRGFDSVTFRDVRNSTGALMGSSILKERHFHGAYDLWLAKSEAWGSLPYWVLDAATLLFA
eukprot:CAMPEP_0117617182 /NCGR_PEP_ID=MMETSP0784-20121206/85464_1 /TAXON_ID=39447 /ORGANISM="" /LENGTH=272 /DNA_ID=CAMNT_0005421023 /DNA_START=208 /DNA_END=1022 /DNA_ORIENTATION=+